MPAALPDSMPEGLLVTPPKGQGNAKPMAAKPADAPLPPPVIIASAKRKTLEIDFGGKPPEEIRNTLKDPALSFRYSGRGTKRGVPAKQWYGPDNPFTRQKIQELFPAATLKEAA